MKKYTLMAPCHFGLESVLKREIQSIGCEITKVEDGRVFFSGDAQGIADANMFLRTTERVLIVAGQVKALTFEELFEETLALPWEEFIPENGRFWVSKATSVSSRLFSPSDIQSIMKKAMVERMKKKYHREWFPEDGDDYPVRVSIKKDIATICIDTSGASLHKRGYRRLGVKAPITETLASALILLTPWKVDRILVDPFCGSGTFPIEAAMIAANMAPGYRRTFLSERWGNLIPKKCWQNSRQKAEDMLDITVKTDIQGYDIDANAIKSARENARMAGVEALIHLQKRPVSDLSHSGSYGFIITNPPYGERIEDKANLPGIYSDLADSYKRLDKWSMYVITAWEDAEKYLGGKADKNRKIYNGMMKTYFYQYLGPKPPRRKS